LGGREGSGVVDFPKANVEGENSVWDTKSAGVGSFVDVEGTDTVWEAKSAGVSRSVVSQGLKSPAGDWIERDRDLKSPVGD
jgi:hypothetical protein